MAVEAGVAEPRSMENLAAGSSDGEAGATESLAA
jgi:hypothetical protein